MFPTGQTCTQPCVGALLGTLAFGLRLPRTTWPVFPESIGPSFDARVLPARALARHDTAGLRAAAQRLDSMSAERVRTESPDDGSAMVAADAYLVLGDSVRALRMVARTLDELMPLTTFREQLVLFTTVSALWPRAMLMRAELEAGMKRPAEARIWYKRFLDLWASPDAEFRPIVARARQGYLAVGGR
jgi:hypothetical protein